MKKRLDMLELALSGLVLSGCSFTLETGYEQEFSRKEYQREIYQELREISPLFILKFDTKKEKDGKKNRSYE